MNRGFTFIELIIVIAILLILILIFFPKINADEKILMINGRILWNDIREIRYIRMTQGTPIKILFPRDCSDYYVITNGDNVIKTVRMDENIEIYHNFDSNKIMFSLNGAPSLGSAGTIKVLNIKSNKFVEITITPVTGRILLKDKIFEGFKSN